MRRRPDLIVLTIDPQPLLLVVPSAIAVGLVTALVVYLRRRGRK